jgi:urease accessory protein UreF
LLTLLDALTTYYIVSAGLGVEATTIVADIINANPSAVFPLVFASATPPAAAVSRLTNALNVDLQRIVKHFVFVVFVVSAAVRMAVVVNNVCVIVVGAAPPLALCFNPS